MLFNWWFPCSCNYENGNIILHCSHTCCTQSCLRVCVWEWLRLHFYLTSRANVFQYTALNLCNVLCNTPFVFGEGISYIPPQRKTVDKCSIMHKEFFQLLFCFAKANRFSVVLVVMPLYLMTSWNLFTNVLSTRRTPCCASLLFHLSEERDCHIYIHLLLWQQAFNRFHVWSVDSFIPLLMQNSAKSHRSGLAFIFYRPLDTKEREDFSSKRVSRSSFLLLQQK